MRRCGTQPNPPGAVGKDGPARVGQTIVFCGLSGWAAGPRKFMKTAARGGTDDRFLSSVVVDHDGGPVLFRPCQARSRQTKKTDRLSHRTAGVTGLAAAEPTTNPRAPPVRPPPQSAPRRPPARASAAVPAALPAPSRAGTSPTADPIAPSGFAPESFACGADLNSQQAKRSLERTAVTSRLTPVSPGFPKAIHRRVSLADCFAVALGNKLDATILTADHHEFDALADRGVCAVGFIHRSWGGASLSSGRAPIPFHLDLTLANLR